MKKMAILLLALACGGTAYMANEGKVQAVSDTQTNSLYVQPIEGLRDKMIKGVDMSSLLALEKSGVTFYDDEGAKQDPIQTLAEKGSNYLRIRVWNDPYTAQKEGYGGGDNVLPPKS